MLLSCKQESALEKALVLAGRNRYELEKVLKYYEKDSLKQVAARFLIENMPHHTYVEEYYLLPGGKKYRPQVADFPVEADYKKHIDSLNDAEFSIIRNHKTDIQTLDSAFLVHNIELAFSGLILGIYLYFKCSLSRLFHLRELSGIKWS